MDVRDRQTFSSGFTLVELSIVLVIIGLIVGGVLVGQDMIRAAEIRATVSQIEKYNAAANTFRDKYNGYPGDLLNATNFAFVTRAGTDSHGDGDGVLEGCYGMVGPMPYALGCETALFWRDLTTANLIGGAFTTATDAVVDSAMPGFNLADYEPTAKLGRGNYIAVLSENGLNQFHISNVVVINGGVVSTSSGLSPQQAFNIDQKIDDGKSGQEPLFGVNSAALFGVA
jgi:prepilin-type N-terminal cleavage/methylation domain-containing protein